MAMLIINSNQWLLKLNEQHAVLFLNSYLFAYSFAWIQNMAEPEKQKLSPFYVCSFIYVIEPFGVPGFTCKWTLGL